MRQQRAAMNVANMVFATERAKALVDDRIKLAREMETDTKSAQRLDRQECKACFYSGRIGGAAMTNRQCMCCGKDMLFGSTATDVLCPECAKAHSLCKRCGGDLEMRVRRKNWPASSLKEDSGAA